MKYGFAFDGDEENLLELAQEAEAGVTWWIESRWQRKAEVLARIRQGPPHLDASSE